MEKQYVTKVGKGQKRGTCRINKIPKSIYGTIFYEVRCVKKNGEVITNDSTTKKGALRLYKLSVNKYLKQS